MKKNEKIIVTAMDYSSSAYAIAKVESFPIFIKDLLVGEQAEIVITKLHKKYGFGKVVRRLSDSSDRVDPICPLFTKCGGCQIMHMSSQAQRKFKENSIYQAIKRNGNIDHPVKPVLVMDNPYYYRNKVMVPVTHDPFKAGFYRTYSHDIVDMETCFIQSEHLNEIYQVTKRFVEKSDLKQVQTIILRHGFKTNEVMVALAINDVFTHEKQLIDELSIFDSVKSIQLNIHRTQSNTVVSDESKVIYGQEYIEEILLGNRFKISLNSFFQVNPVQTEVLYQTAFDLADLKATDTVIDLYSGVGTIGLLVARHVKKVISVEIVEAAVNDAKENARINGIDNVEFVCGDASEFVANYQQQPDVVFVDPPRKGLHPQGIEDILNLRANRIVYISCNPETLGRDLKAFVDDYRIEVIQPVDMFSMTYHVETVVLMSRIDK